MFKEKKQPKVMNHGWRGDALIAGRLKMMELGLKDKHGEEFSKTEMMDRIVSLGMDALEAENGQ